MKTITFCILLAFQFELYYSKRTENIENHFDHARWKEGFKKKGHPAFCGMTFSLGIIGFEAYCL